MEAGGDGGLGLGRVRGLDAVHPAHALPQSRQVVQAAAAERLPCQQPVRGRREADLWMMLSLHSGGPCWQAMEPLEARMALPKGTSSMSTMERSWAWITGYSVFWRYKTGVAEMEELDSAAEAYDRDEVATAGTEPLVEERKGELLARLGRLVGSTGGPRIARLNCLV